MWCRLSFTLCLSSIEVYRKYFTIGSAQVIVPRKYNQIGRQVAKYIKILD